MIESFVLLLAYLLGSICSAIIISKAARLPDPRLQGSKNPGATNILRLGGKKLAALTLLLDALKGFLAVIIARLLGLEILSLVVLAAVLGHVFPVFYGFSGGKGIATAIGGILAYSPLLAVIGILTWVAIAWFARYSSLASLLAVAAVLVASFFEQATLALPGLALLIVWTHRENIYRLYRGEESRLQF